MTAQQLRLTLRRDGWRRERFTAWVDPDDGGELRRLLRDAMERDGAAPRHAAAYTLDVDPPRGRSFVVAA